MIENALNILALAEPGIKRPDLSVKNVKQLNLKDDDDDDELNLTTFY